MKHVRIWFAIGLLTFMGVFELRAECRDWGCFQNSDDGSVSCQLLICPSWGCTPPAKYALSCTVVCDGPACWCRYNGYCYDI